MDSPGRPAPRVAIASIGLGRIQRGYERYVNGVFQCLRQATDITLYKGGGETCERERVPAHLETISQFCGALPLGLVAGGAEYRRYKNDCLAFALALLPELRRERFDVIHVLDHPLAKALLRLRRIVPFPARVIFADGGLMPPQYYPRDAHFIHHVAQVQHEAALAWGIPAERSMMVPCGLSTRQFAQGRPRAELRRQYGIRDETFVILAVSAVKKVHKRVDHIIEEASRLEGDFLLWIDGQPDDADLVELARRKLGDKCRLSCVPTPSVPDLYHFSDVFVHAALEEGFGLAICEAASAGLPLAIHDSPHFRWLLDDPTMLVDMRAPGQLAEALQARMSAPPAPKNTQLAAKIAARFDWDAVGPQYLEMYRRAAAMPERDES